MKNLIALMLYFFSLSVVAQSKIEIKVDNIEPRVGQNVVVSFTPDFFSKYLKNKFDNSVHVTNLTAINPLITGGITYNLMFDEAKTYQIGPFNFDFNGEKYTTDSVIIKVRPSLPTKDGIWLRLIVMNGTTFLELEQKFTQNSSFNSIPYSTSEKNKQAKLNLKLTKGIDLVVINSTSNTTNESTSSLIKYKVVFNDDFSGSYEIKKTDFTNFPENFQIDKVELKKNE